MKKTSIILTVFLFAFALAQAQTTFGIRAGVNLQNINGKSGGNNLEYKITPGFNIGVNAEMGVAPDFYFQPGVLFTTKGANLDTQDNAKVSLSYIEVPLNLIYKPVLGTGKLIAGFGPYVAYGIGGKYKDDNGEDDINFGSDAEEDDLKPLDMGANLLFGYELASKLSVQMNVQLGLLNLVPDGDSDNSMKNTGFGVSFGYRF
jgi:hypothetical protein